MNVANIATLGVNIDPTEAVKGAATATQAAQKMGDAWDKIVKSFQNSQGIFSNVLGSIGGAFARMANAILTHTGVFGRAMTTMVRAAASAAGAIAGTVSQITGAFGRLAGAVGGSVRGLTNAFAQFGLAVQGVRTIVDPIVGLVSSVLDTAGNFEIFNQKWAFLLGSFDKAKEKVNELQQFANATPFDLPGVNAAALALYKLKDAALEGKKGLNLVGDAAAMAVSAEGPVQIQEMALKVARLYGNLKAGNGGGDELRMMRDWQVISAEAGLAIGKMGQDASKFKEAWALVVSELQKSEGAMKVQSTSWQGLTSSLSDAWNTLKTAVGTPILEGLKPLLVDLQAVLGDLTRQALEFAPAIKSVVMNIPAAFAVMRQEGGLKLAFTAATDYLKDFFDRLWRWTAETLSNVFDWIARKFQKAMAYIASEEFWSGVGKALVKAAASMIDTLKEFATGHEGGGAIGSLGDLSSVLKPRTPEQVREILKTNPNAYNANSPDALEGLAKSPLDDSPSLFPEFPDSNPTEAVKEWTAAIKDSKEELEKNSGNILLENEKIVKDAAARQNQAGPALPASVDKKAEREAAHLQTLANKYIDMDPKADFDRKMKELDMLRDKGLLNESQYRIAVEKTTEEYHLAMKKRAEDAEHAAEAQMTALQKLAHEWGKLKKNMETAAAAIATAISDNISTAISGLILGTESLASAFQKMAQGIVTSIVQIITKLYVQYALSKLLGMVGGGAGSFSAFGVSALSSAVHHDGGIVGDGAGGRTRLVGASSFTSAARFHSGGMAGLRSGEVPAVLEKGEEVITARESASRRKKELTGAKESPQGGGLTVINLIDPAMIPATMAQNPGAFLNIVGTNGKAIKQILARA